MRADRVYARRAPWPAPADCPTGKGSMACLDPDAADVL
jgi:hypothetical protein